MRLVYIDENFCDFSGHNAAYALAIKDEWVRRGRSFTIYANRRIDSALAGFNDIVPAFTVKSSSLHRIGFGRGMGRMGQVMRLVYSNFAHGWALIKKVAIRRDCSVVLIAGISPRVTLAYLVWLIYLSLTGRRTTVVILLHDRAPWFAGIEFRLLRIAGYRQKIRLAAQSPRIAEDFRVRFGHTISAMPTPQVSLCREKTRAARLLQGGGGRLNLVYLGLASSAKGFGFLVDAITSPEMMEYLASVVKFTIQYNPIAGDGIAESAGQRLLKVCEESDMFGVICGSLANDAYENELENADAILLPYNPLNYRFIQSGIVTQAIAAGKPLLVSAGTTLEQEMQLHGTGISFKYGSIASLREALRQVIGRIDVLSSEAEMRALGYRQIHGPAAYVTALEKIARDARSRLSSYE